MKLLKEADNKIKYQDADTLSKAANTPNYSRKIESNIKNSITNASEKSLKEFFNDPRLKDLQPQIASAYIDKYLNNDYKKVKDSLIQIILKDGIDFDSNPFKLFLDNFISVIGKEKLNNNLVATIYNLLEDKKINYTRDIRNKDSLLYNNLIYNEDNSEDALYKLKALLFLRDKDNLSRYGAPTSAPKMSQLLQMKAPQIKKALSDWSTTTQSQSHRNASSSNRSKGQLTKADIEKIAKQVKTNLDEQGITTSKDTNKNIVIDVLKSYKFTKEEIKSALNNVKSFENVDEAIRQALQTFDKTK